ncbi:hypothetical protein WMY93_010754 [Mugilogobius chulae]|uniref:Protein phosphatase 1 regulatory subunit 1B n=1 Tax=Mugilogobius chulae TaxID=88201 RepID=A0AAW0P877_9GOBI
MVPIRRRRPTPATLFRLTDPPSPEEDSGSQQWMLTDNGVLKSRLTHTYQPPSLKVVQKMAQAHLACLPSMDKDDSDEDVDKGCEVHHKTNELQADVQRLQDHPAHSDKSSENHQPSGEKDLWDNGSF